MTAITQAELDTLLTKHKITYTDFKNFAGNTMKTFKTTRDFRDEFLDSANLFEEEKAYNAVAYLAYQSVVVQPRLKWIKVPGAFELADEDDKKWFSITIFRLVVFLTRNDNIYETITGQSIDTPNFKFSKDTSRNLISNDVLGTYIKDAIKLSELDKYQLFETKEDTKIYSQNTNGIIRFMGEI